MYTAGKYYNYEISRLEKSIACTVFFDIWAMSWENLIMACANNKGADQPEHPRSLSSTFVFCFLYSTIPLLAISEISSL